LTEWWNSIPDREKIYWYFAIPFTTLFIIQTILSFVGMAHGDISDIDVDAPGSSVDAGADLSGSDFDSDTFEDPSSAFRLLTIRNFIIFFTVFAWTGIVLSKSTMNNIVAAVLSCISGLVVAFIISSIFYLMTKLAENGTMNIKKAVGCVGEVYLTVPPKRKDTGKVIITIQGVSRELDAVTDGKELPTGTTIKVVGVVDNRVLLVEKNN